MVSGGGRAKGVSEAQARDAIRRGNYIAIDSAGSLLNPVFIKFEQPPGYVLRRQTKIKQTSQPMSALGQKRWAGLTPPN